MQKRGSGQFFDSYIKDNYQFKYHLDFKEGEVKVTNTMYRKGGEEEVVQE